MDDRKKTEEILYRKKAMDLLELARRHLEKGLVDAIQHVYRIERDYRLPGADQACQIAEDAVERVLIARGGRAIPNEAARSEGPSILDEAIRDLKQTEVSNT